MPTLTAKQRRDTRPRIGVPPFAPRVLYPELPRTPRLTPDDLAHVFGGVTDLNGVPVEMRLDLPPILPRPAPARPAAAVADPLQCPVCGCLFDAGPALAKHVVRHPLTRDLAELVGRLMRTSGAEVLAAQASGVRLRL